MVAPRGLSRGTFLPSSCLFSPSLGSPAWLEGPDADPPSSCGPAFSSLQLRMAAQLLTRTSVPATQPLTHHPSAAPRNAECAEGKLVELDLTVTGFRSGAGNTCSDRPLTTEGGRSIRGVWRTLHTASKAPSGALLQLSAVTQPRQGPDFCRGAKPERGTNGRSVAHSPFCHSKVGPAGGARPRTICLSGAFSQVPFNGAGRSAGQPGPPSNRTPPGFRAAPWRRQTRGWLSCTIVEDSRRPVSRP